MLARPPIWLVLAFVLTALGVVVPEGFWLCLPAAALAFAALRRAGATPGGAPRGLAWAGFLAPLLVLLTVFTVRVAVPNIVSAGNAANHTLAASTLRTVLWAEDQMVAQAGRAGILAELAGRAPLENGEPLATPLLRAEMAPLAQGIAVFSGYAYRVYVADTAGPDAPPATDGAGRPAAGGRHFLAYAWPVLPGRSGLSVYCLNENEDIFEAAGADLDPPYAGLGRQPAWNACLTPGARFGDRPTGGMGGDGAIWQRWKGRPTRRARADAPATSSP